MTFPVSGTPAYGAGAIAPGYSGTFIPELWAAKLIEKFYDATVLAAIANTDYAGEIANQGDKVHIRQKPTLTINTYQAGQALTLERPSSDIVTLVIDEGRYFAAIVDDVHEIQSDMNMLGMWADDASEQMKIAVDSEVLTNIATDAAAANVGATAGRISSSINMGATGSPLELVPNADGSNTDVIDAIVRAGQVLDEQNIPETGRWMVIPAWMAAMIKRSELRDASLVGETPTMLRNGRLGMIDRFTLYMSNLLPTAAEAGGSGIDATYVFAGHSHGLTFASQLTKMETLRAEQTFGTIMRGLQVFGYKVTDGTALTYLYARKVP